LLAFDGVANRPDEQLRRRLSFDQIVLCAALHGLQREDLVLCPCQNHQRKVGGRTDETVQRFEFLRVRQTEVEQHGVVRAVGQLVDGRVNRRGVIEGHRHTTRGVQHRARQFRVRGVVLDEQYAEWRFRHIRRAPSQG
jgi:hypothetical protein